MPHCCHIGHLLLVTVVVGCFTSETPFLALADDFHFMRYHLLLESYFSSFIVLDSLDFLITTG
jgi:hypothetical protein